MNIWNFLGHGSTTEILPPAYEEGATLESLDRDERAEIAHRLMGGLFHLLHFHPSRPQGLLTISVNGFSQLMNVIPGLRTLDADTMNGSDVMRLAQYVQQHEPELFTQVLTELNQEWPECAEALRGAIRDQPAVEATLIQ